jgi:hypothetical protein
MRPKRAQTGTARPETAAQPGGRDWRRRRRPARARPQRAARPVMATRLARASRRWDRCGDLDEELTKHRFPPLMRPDKRAQDPRVQKSHAGWPRWQNRLPKPAEGVI